MQDRSIYSRSVGKKADWLKSLNRFRTMRRVQETREGVFGHQSIDSLLCLVECVGARRVHHTQQSLASLSIQVYLRAKAD